MNQVMIKNINSDYSVDEAYKRLRTNLQFCGSDKKVIAITSCTPNEGKSTVSIQLCKAIADSGKRVVLVDADLRKSTLMKRIQTGQGTSIKGLTHLLSGQTTLENSICSTNVKNLYLVTPGPFPPNPAELLGSPAFAQFLSTLKKVYDYVIVDTPPLGSVVDSAIISENCDGCMLVVQSGSIGYRFAQEVKIQLERSGCPFLGVVLNKVDLRNGFLSKYYGKYYGKFYGKEN